MTLKNIPDRLYERLKHFAKLHHRSLNSEVIFLLERSAGLAQEDSEALRDQAQIFRKSIGAKGEFPVGDVEKAINEGTL